MVFAINHVDLSNLPRQGHWTMSYPDLGDITAAVIQDQFNFGQSDYYRFLMQIGFDPHLHNSHLDALKDAYNFVAMAHYGQSRNSGEPHLEHVIRVTELAMVEFMDKYEQSLRYMSHQERSEIGLMLDLYANLTEIGRVGKGHDTEEDNPFATHNALKEFFGIPTADRINGLSKSGWTVENGVYQSVKYSGTKIEEAYRKHDFFQKLISIADRVDNLRTLGYLPQDNQFRKLLSTFTRYITLAEEEGWDRLATEMELKVRSHKDADLVYTLASEMSVNPFQIH